MIFKGTVLRQKYLDFLRFKVQELEDKTGLKPGLAVVMVGKNPSSLTYVNAKKKWAQSIGVLFKEKSFEESVGEEEIRRCIETLNHDERVSAIIVQLPLPAHINSKKVLNYICPCKDVDGLSDKNLGALMRGYPNFVPCTPLGIIKILRAHSIATAGRSVLIIGRSPLVGRPLANLLSSQPYNATVTLAHSKTPYIEVHARLASIIVVATGVPKLLKANMVSSGSVVIDVGITHTSEGLCGDVDFERVKGKCSFITPVPGGVGVMTVTMLLYNTVKAAYMQHSLVFEDHEVVLFT
ncbi:UNVERIFIED_CONTAM: hypothetical protein PYX00_011230 [Menopon gallinae]|uniref:Methenyltetrahydrofolate cyclohydrolase n=1 Tax=Menopon gallinae TaxID=328185 RepID=A0AAW2H6S3_9NEOP